MKKFGSQGRRRAVGDGSAEEAATAPVGTATAVPVDDGADEQHAGEATGRGPAPERDDRPAPGDGASVAEALWEALAHASDEQPPTSGGDIKATTFAHPGSRWVLVVAAIAGVAALVAGVHFLTRPDKLTGRVVSPPPKASPGAALR